VRLEPYGLGREEKIGGARGRARVDSCRCGFLSGYIARGIRIA